MGIHINPLILIFTLVTLQGYSQCKVKTNYRSDGIIVRYQNAEMIGSGKNYQLGLSVMTNGKNYFLCTTIRYFSSPTKTIGTLKIALKNNHSFELKLYTCELTKDRDEHLALGVFYLTESDVAQLKQAKI